MSELVKVYQYKDLTGKVIHETCRYSPKDFRQRRPDGKGGYIWNLQDIEPVLYRLPEITKAIRAGEVIYLCEGEKDADNLAKLGLESTTAPMGVGTWRKSYTDTLNHAQVVICPDKDTAGLNAVFDVADALYQQSGEVKIIRLPGTGKDVTDWIEQGGTADMLQELIEATPPYMTMPKYNWRKQMFEACETELYFWLMIINERQFEGDYEALQAIKYELKRREKKENSIKPEHKKYYEAITKINSH